MLSIQICGTVSLIGLTWVTKMLNVLPNALHSFRLRHRLILEIRRPSNIITRCARQLVTFKWTTVAWAGPERPLLIHCKYLLYRTWVSDANEHDLQLSMVVLQGHQSKRRDLPDLG